MTFSVQPIRVSWPQVIRDLESRGWSQYRIAQTLGLETSTVQYWAKAKRDIGWGYGRALMSLHLAVCGQSCTEIRITEAEVPA